MGGKLPIKTDRRLAHGNKKIMSKIAVVYWSGTGNTEAMASAVARAAKAAGADVELLTAAEFDAGTVGQYDAIAFGCPAMGEETLEEEVFAPMFESVKGALTDDRVRLPST